ncbi:MAG: rod shape-determining protein RodA [Acidobacteriota bacterium]|nr:rod shape-determining protein RodA [Acidobacteriota bacterium]MDE3043382.1 rod shape-determining protein RodA [Acidobacteriota bacterium]MDE3222119.1 rod shape-determining protein RodA [Acidobacteriota bacterium]
MTDTLLALTTRVRARDAMDYGLFWGMIALGVTGTIMIYSATRQALVNAGFSGHYYLERQGFFVGVGIVAMYVVSRLDYRRFEMVATPLYVGSLFALAGVFVVGQSALGAQRWYNFGFVQLQPSEFTVLSLILAVATFCARRPEGLTMYDVTRLLTMAAVPMLLIFKQPDLGTTVIIVLTVSAMMVLAGVPPRFMSLLAVLGSIGVAMAIYLQLLHKYQVDRFVSFLNQNSTNPNLQALIYEVNNAKSAIGSGGLRGAGFFHGLQTVLGYVPEQRTDFIFTAIGEQLGFIGSTLIVTLLGFVAYRMFMIGRRAKDTMGRLICIGVFVFFAFSCFENIGMTMGIMPVTGIPLPLLSYGGSAALVFFVAGGAVLSVSRRAGN